MYPRVFPPKREFSTETDDIEEAELFALLHDNENNQTTLERSYPSAIQQVNIHLYKAIGKTVSFLYTDTIDEHICQIFGYRF